MGFENVRDGSLGLFDIPERSARFSRRELFFGGPHISYGLVERAVVMMVVGLGDQTRQAALRLGLVVKVMRLDCVFGLNESGTHILGGLGSIPGFDGVLGGVQILQRPLEVVRVVVFGIGAGLTGDWQRLGGRNQTGQQRGTENETCREHRRLPA
jgi:hypothetical protein